jgi:hypothetical protein
MHRDVPENLLGCLQTKPNWEALVTQAVICHNLKETIQNHSIN